MLGVSPSAASLRSSQNVTLSCGISSIAPRDTGPSPDLSQTLQILGCTGKALTSRMVIPIMHLWFVYLTRLVYLLPVGPQPGLESGVRFSARLEEEDLVFELRNGPGSWVAQLLQVTLHGAHHGWWSAHEDFRSNAVVWRTDAAGGLVLLDHFFSDEACSLVPVGGGFVEAVLGVSGGMGWKRQSASTSAHVG